MDALKSVQAARAHMSSHAWLVPVFGCPGAQLLLPTAALRAAADVAADALVAARIAPCRLCSTWHRHAGSASPLARQAVLHDQSTYTPAPCTVALGGPDALASPLLLGSLPRWVIAVPQQCVASAYAIEPLPSHHYYATLSLSRPHAPLRRCHRNLVHVALLRPPLVVRH